MASNTRNNTGWCKLKSILQGGRYDYACCEIDDHRMIIAGGLDSDGFLLSCCVSYDARTEQWTRLPNNMPSALFDCRSVVSSNGTYMYVIGGRGSSGAVNIMYRLSLENYKWTSMASMGTARALCAAVLKGDYIYIFGGINRYVLASAERYSIDDNAWEALPDMANGRYNHCAVTASSRSDIYIVSGCTMLPIDILDTKTLMWKNNRLSIPESRTNAATVMLKDRYLVIVGGYNSPALGGVLAGVFASSRCLIYDCLYSRWSWTPTFMEMNTARGYHTTAVLGEKVIVAGGKNSGHILLSSMEVVDTRTVLEFAPVIYPLPDFLFNQILQIGKAVDDEVAFGF